MVHHNIYVFPEKLIPEKWGEHILDQDDRYFKEQKGCIWIRWTL